MLQPTETERLQKALPKTVQTMNITELHSAFREQ